MTEPNAPTEARQDAEGPLPFDAEAGASPRPPYLWALVAGCAVFLLYAITLARTTAFWDTSEYIATGHILGIPHPPGNPLFVVLARAWSILLEPTGLSVAVRINLFSAFMSASAHALWFLVLHHVLRTFSKDRVFRLVGAGAATLVSATAFTVWNQSNVNEKVYTVSLLTIALLSWLIVRWQEKLGDGKDDNLLVLMAFILALSVGNHLMAFLAAPAIGVFILRVHPRVLLNWKLYPPVVIAVLLGLSIHLFLPLRANLAPVINEAAPECETLPSSLVSIATYGNAGCEPLNAALKREQYDKPALNPRQAPLHSQFLNYLQYFDWQWARSVDGRESVLPPLRVLFTMLFTGLGVWGAMEHHKRDRTSFWYVAVLLGTLSVGLVYYLNFKYGYSIPDPQNDYTLHEVRERDYFFIVSFSVWGLWAGLGIAAIWQTVSERMKGWSRGAPVLGLALIPLVLNWPWATRHYDYAARDWAYNLLMSVEPYGVLFTNGDNDTFPLWYLQEVESIRRDVTVIVTSYLNTAWYAKQLRQLTTPCGPDEDWTDDPTRIICQREYLPNTPAVYTDDPAAAEAEGKTAIPLDEVRAPTRGIFPADFDDATVEQIGQSYFQLDRARQFAFGEVRTVLPEGTVLFPWHQYTLGILSNALGDRPIYFASSGNAAESLGLETYLVRHGLAFKLYEGQLLEERPIGVIPMPPDSPLTPVTGSWVDLPRTEQLADEVFVHRGDLPNWSHWPDIATLGIPNYYAWVYYSLAQAVLSDTGDEALMEQWRDRGEAWSALGS
ncbi:MAG: DUF2723 domain-containing protein [Gemmatimonadetes bacterium]|nr:DUF2723 domain-containing protein [Gemmatimonadota bacterium]NNK63495.1 DUF2723 domain-containing protein [Gemmatimonadota bacterium]